MNNLPGCRWSPGESGRSSSSRSASNTGSTAMEINYRDRLQEPSVPFPSLPFPSLPSPPLPSPPLPSPAQSYLLIRTEEGRSLGDVGRLLPLWDPPLPRRRGLLPPPPPPSSSIPLPRHRGVRLPPGGVRLPPGGARLPPGGVRLPPGGGAYKTLYGCSLAEQRQNQGGNALQH